MRCADGWKLLGMYCRERKRERKREGGGERGGGEGREGGREGGRERDVGKDILLQRNYALRDGWNLLGVYWRERERDAEERERESVGREGERCRYTVL